MTVSKEHVDVELPDPIGYLADIEAAWQAHDGRAAASGYTDDAVIIFGNGQRRSGAEIKAWPQQWFDFAKDLRITKTFRAYSGNCLASEWASEYTHPETGKIMYERGAEFFFIRPDGKIYRHHAFEHTWAAGENVEEAWPAV